MLTLVRMYLMHDTFTTLNTFGKQGKKHNINSILLIYMRCKISALKGVLTQM